MSAEWIKMAKVGDRVLCIANAIGKTGEDLGFPLFRKGGCYTISEIRLLEMPSGGLEPFLFFTECNPRHSGHYNGFRPVQPRKTDISQFQALLTSTPTQKPVRENA